jgi:glycosyltransferase involved in cell wall biosynthesis
VGRSGFGPAKNSYELYRVDPYNPYNYSISDQMNPDSPKRKIFIVANSFWNLLNFRSGLIKALIDQGFEVMALAIADDHLSEVQKLGCETLPINFKANGLNPFKDLSLLLELMGLMLRHKPIGALLFTAKPNVYGSLAATFLRVPYINNVSGLGSVFIKAGLLSKLMSHLYKISFYASAIVYFQNRDDQDLFVSKNLVKRYKSAVLPGSGVNLENYKPQNEGSDQAEGAFSFILIARLLRDKGVIEFLEAASIVHVLYPQVKFKLLGFLGVDNPTAITQVEVQHWFQKKYIEYLGHAGDVRPFIESSHCVVLPSYREGTPKTLLEAAAMGKPIITTLVPGCKDVVEDGETGFLCTARDPKDLALKMIQMLELSSSERAQMGVKARYKMEQEYSEAIVIEQYLRSVKAHF